MPQFKFECARKKSLRRRRKKTVSRFGKKFKTRASAAAEKNEFVILMMPPLTTASGSVGTSFVLDVLLVKLILSRNTIFFYFQCIKHQALDFFVTLAWQLATTGFAVPCFVLDGFCLIDIVH